MKRILILFELVLLAVVACRKDAEEPINVPTINDEVQAFETYATIKGTINCVITTQRVEMYLYTNQNISSPDVYELELIGGKSFEITVQDLQPSTIYNYRFILYSDVDKARLGGKKFKTLNADIPTVHTLDIDTLNIGLNRAIIGGEVLHDGGYPITARGMCWSTMPDPLVIDNYTTDSVGMGTYSSTLTNLALGTTYYVRAYATNQKGTAYGDIKTFTTLEGYPKVSTAEVTDITSSSALCGGIVLSNGGFSVTARGVCWSKSPNPTFDDNHTIDGIGLGSFVSTLMELEKGTTYYIRAYAINNFDTTYGEERIFSTLVPDTDNFICGHEYVDLGLPSGLKWATCNIGASVQWEYGNYYSWGELTTKDSYVEENAITLGIEMDDISGDAIYDVATANWGCTWRIPTKEDMEELVYNCTWTWVVQPTFVGITYIGYQVTGPNGNSIYLPAGGCQRTSWLYGDIQGCYWTSTPKGEGDSLETYNTYAYYLNFFDIPYSYHGVNYSGRNYGMTIRPVSN